jgi:hypothetical protein
MRPINMDRKSVRGFPITLIQNQSAMQMHLIPPRS